MKSWTPNLYPLGIFLILLFMHLLKDSHLRSLISLCLSATLTSEEQSYKKKKQLIWSEIWYRRKLCFKTLFTCSFWKVSCVIFQGHPGSSASDWQFPLQFLRGLADGLYAPQLQNSFVQIYALHKCFPALFIDLSGDSSTEEEGRTEKYLPTLTKTKKPTKQQKKKTHTKKHKNEKTKKKKLKLSFSQVKISFLFFVIIGTVGLRSNSLNYKKRKQRQPTTQTSLHIEPTYKCIAKQSTSGQHFLDFLLP